MASVSFVEKQDLKSKALRRWEKVFCSAGIRKYMFAQVAAMFFNAQNWMGIHKNHGSSRLSLLLYCALMMKIFDNKGCTDSSRSIYVCVLLVREM